MKKRKIPKQFIKCPSPLINEFTEFLNRSSLKYVPQFSLQTAITFFGHLYARNYEGETGVSTGIYSMLIGRSGIGKNYCQSGIMGIDTLHTHIVSGATSESGLRSAMIDNPSLLIVSDEMGSKFNSKDKNDKEYSASLRESFSSKKMPPKSFSGFNKGRHEKNDNDYTIHFPCISILGLTTPGQLEDGLSENDIESGTVNRFILVNAETHEVIRNIDEINYNVPGELMSKLYVTSKLSCEIGLESYKKKPDLIKIKFDDGVFKWFLDESDKLLNGKNSAYTVRAVEIAMRLSLIIAVSMNLSLITKEIARWSLDYCIYWAYNIKTLSGRVGENDYAKIKDRIIEKLKSNGGEIKIGKMNDSILKGCKPFERDTIYNDLISSRQITVTKIPQESGRPYDLIELGEKWKD